MFKINFECIKLMSSPQLQSKLRSTLVAVHWHYFNIYCSGGFGSFVPVFANQSTSDKLFTDIHPPPHTHTHKHPFSKPGKLVVVGFLFLTKTLPVMSCYWLTRFVALHGKIPLL